ncbi:MAG: hypothetical protein ACOVPA_23490, partial [Rubrivivax sp.]
QSTPGTIACWKERLSKPPVEAGTLPPSAGLAAEISPSIVCIERHGPVGLGRQDQSRSTVEREPNGIAQPDKATKPVAMITFEMLDTFMTRILVGS